MTEKQSNRYIELDEKVKQVMSENVKLEERLKRTEEHIEGLQQELDTKNRTGVVGSQLKKTSLVNTQYEIQCRKMEEILSDNVKLKTFLRRTEKELKGTQQQLQDTKNQLSKCMGDTITDNNLTITDLSDMNRPSKLAERFKELYDNQWTDAFELLEKRLGEDENKTISILLTIFIKTKEFCDQESQRQMEEIQKVITQSEKVRKRGVPDLVVKYIKNCRRDSSSESIREMYKKYQTWLRSGQLSDLKYATSIKDYTDECFEICWLMAIVDPPVDIAQKPKQGENIQPELYSAYTVSGKLVDFLVWPALLLHKDGPVIAKGVVQALKRPISAPAVVRTERSKDFQPGYDIGHRISRTKNEGTLSSRNIPEALAEEDDVRNKYRPDKQYDQDNYRDEYGYEESKNYKVRDLRQEIIAANHPKESSTQMAIPTLDQYGAYTLVRTPYTPSGALVTRYFNWKQKYGVESARRMMGSDYDRIKYFS